MKIENSIDELKTILDRLQIDEQLIDLSDESAYFLYHLIDIVSNWFFRKHELKITRVILHKYQLDAEKEYDPRQCYSYDDDNDGSTNYKKDFPF